jgi:hypothetical protein
MLNNFNKFYAMKTMKKIYAMLAPAALCLLFSACNDEWTDEQYEKSVSFVSSARRDVVNVYLKYTASGVAPYKVPIVLSGSTGNDRNVEVQVSVDPDTMENFNKGRFQRQTQLYFKLLGEEYYEFPGGATATIPAGQDVGLLDVNFKLAGLDMVDKYILPLKIEATSGYPVAPRQGYAKTLMRIIPFNDFSGTYAPAAGVLKMLTKNSQSSVVKFDTTPIGTYEEEREARVVDDTTVFFYAGLVQELDSQRALYKIRMAFHANGKVTLTADSARIDFWQDTGAETGTYEVTVTTDPLAPYLERWNTIVSLTYKFTDYTNPAVPITYLVEGYRMRMERKRNTLIPEQDQQFIFD